MGDMSLEKSEENHKKSFKNCLNQLAHLIVGHYLPISLLVAVFFGITVPGPGVFFNKKATVYFCISILLLYSGLYLKTSAMKTALKSYKSYIWGVVSILGVTCVVSGQLTRSLNLHEIPSVSNNNTNGSSDIVAPSSRMGPREFQVGVILYTSMPCSVGTGIIMVIIIIHGI